MGVCVECVECVECGLVAASLPLSSGSKVSEGTALPVATLRILVCGVCGVGGVWVECV